MTDAAFYAEMEQLALELLTDFGIPATYRYQPPKPKPNNQGIVITPKAEDKAGLAVRTNSEAVAKMFERSATAIFVAKFPVEPQTEHKLLTNGETWKIQELKVIKPIGSMIICFASCVAP